MNTAVSTAPALDTRLLGDAMAPPSEDSVAQAVTRFEPISLAELNAQARLMTRVDRKYFLPRTLFSELLDQTRDEFRVLDIRGRRRFHYRSVYFDTPEHRFLRDHVQERRHRFKVRTRTYVDTESCHLEVKSKGYRGQTVKERIAHPLHSPQLLSAPDREFIAQCLGSQAAARIGVHTLEPALETLYDRVTLCHESQRLTCDLNLVAQHGDEKHVGPDDVLVETKSADGKGIWDALLKAAGVRAHRVSKYCIFASLLYPQLPSNPWNRTIQKYFA
jgi:hypothetical protein